MEDAQASTPTDDGSFNERARSDLLNFLQRHEAGPAVQPKNGDNGAVSLPPPPKSIEATGLSMSFLIELVLKIIHYTETPTAEYIARILGLPANLTGHILDSMKSDRLCEVISTSSYDLTTAYRFRLTEKGETRAEQALERCRYAGAAPVPLVQYEKVIASQALDRWRPPLETIRAAAQALVLDPESADLLERALHSGRSTMVYGPSGNGKTHLLTEFVNHLQGEVLVPYALYVYGQIIRLYDPLVHKRADRQPAAPVSDSPATGKNGAPLDDSGDRRWVRIRRPGIIVGGEFSAESLELGYDPVARFYQAPKHLKAQGGVLVVDDFGRQKVAPSELLNRWIMALERGRDNLLLRTGESIDIPFCITLLFSTNLDPMDLADAAYLRRIPYKAFMPPVSPPQFTEILRRVVAEEGVHATDEDLAATVDYLFQTVGDSVSGSLARDLVWIVIDNAHHEGRQPTLTVPDVDLAYRQFTGVAGRRVLPQKPAVQG